MANMSYCRHENTLRDLQDVYDRWDEFDPYTASKSEIRARKKLAELVHEMADYVDIDEYEND